MRVFVNKCIPFVKNMVSGILATPYALGVMVPHISQDLINNKQIINLNHGMKNLQLTSSLHAFC